MGSRLFNWKGIKSIAVRCMLAEMLGTFLLVAFGDGSVAQMVTTKNAGSALNSYLSVNFGFFCGITFGVYASVGISGGHINPAVTLAMAIVGRLEWYKVPFYMIGQYVGAFLASIFVYVIYLGGLKGDFADDGGIWATQRGAFTTTGMAFGDQIFGTFLLLVCVLALTDSKNGGPPKGVVPVLVGFVVFGVGLAFGTNAGFAINPARDFGPRVWEALVYGGETFSKGDYYFWVPILGPHVGAILGAFVYILMVEMHHPSEEEPLTKLELEEVEEEEESLKPNGDQTKLTFAA